ncbi:MAG: clan AA aspartic protease [Planctomycetota bacterium]
MSDSAIVGKVDEFGRALISIVLRSANEDASQSIEVWIDTGFNGDLVLPQQVIEDLELRPSGTLKAVLADGSEVALRRYTCTIAWFEHQRELEVVANEGEYPLLGVGLLLGRDLQVSYRTGAISIS